MSLKFLLFTTTLLSSDTFLSRILLKHESPILVSAVFGGHQSPSRPFYVRFFTRLDSEIKNFCGGTVIASKWVVTAATCIEHGNQFVVEFSPFEIEHRDSLIYTIEDFFIHPGFYPLQSDASPLHNIALLKLQEVFPAGTELELCNIRESLCNKMGFCGMGSTFPNPVTYPQTLREVFLTETFRRVGLFGRLPAEFIDMRREEHGYLASITCHGDMGGPLYTLQRGTNDPVCLYGLAMRFSLDPNKTDCENNLASFISIPFFRNWIVGTINANGGP